MIGKLKGLIDSGEADHVIIDVGGVGYLVYASGKTLAALPPAGEAAELVIETHVREDHIHLYGFSHSVERDWFRLLVTVQGVGVRMALAILGLYTPEELTTIIAAQDKKALTAVSGVGSKLAERIMTELKNKVGTLPTGATVIDHPASPAAGTSGGLSEDAVSALVNLGYGRAEAYRVVTGALQKDAGASLDALIKEGLKQLAS